MHIWVGTSDTALENALVYRHTTDLWPVLYLPVLQHTLYRRAHCAAAGAECCCYCEPISSRPHIRRSVQLAELCRTTRFDFLDQSWCATSWSNVLAIAAPCPHLSLELWMPGVVFGSLISGSGGALWSKNIGFLCLMCDIMYSALSLNQLHSLFAALSLCQAWYIWAVSWWLQRDYNSSKATSGVAW